MKLLKKCNVPLLVIGIITLVLFIVTTFFDKPVSEALWNTYKLDIPWITIVFTLLGPLVTNAFGAFAGSSMFFAMQNNKKSVATFIKIIGLLGILAVSFFAYTAGTEFADVIPHLENEKVRSGLYYLVFSLVAISDIIIFLLVYKNYKKLDQHNLLWVSSTMLIILALTAGGTEAIKYLVSRPRPRIVFPGQEQYMEWWQLRPFYGFKVSESKSFISGHSSNAGSIPALLTLFLSVTKLSEKKRVVLVSITIGVVYCVILATTRVLALAHWISDVTGGLLYSFIASIVGTRLMLYFEKKAGEKTPAVSN